MISILIFSQTNNYPDSLARDLTREGFSVKELHNLDDKEAGEKPDIVLVDIAAGMAVSENGSLVTALKEAYPVPLLVLIRKESIKNIEPDAGINDFIVLPYYLPELLLRVKKALWEKENITSENIIKQGDLLINLSTYRVFIAGTPVDLTFKEYELLRYLAANPGKVFSRDTLLNKVWGFDYFGGDRTVDVHVRRLRSKVEDATHSFIETVRNVGYRFKKSN
ncbi:MAG: response regulator transcription factor [Dehalococcoidia bacterium]|nr:response regulator transcription factor [Dehalococcoidia bacterium]MDZ4247516.1 response regulator transcription factor [Dehalococcoidia bacterium]